MLIWGDDYPRGIRYPAIELVRDGQIHVPECLKFIDWFKAHVDLGLEP